ncbi:MAG: uroporphyrinogen-III synthase [Coriobacteriales bacterium]|nr:uroporphyrinogen-III synthase [Actinomycetes bacterium]
MQAPEVSRTAGPLQGRSVVITRAIPQAGALASLLEEAGAEVLAFPTIEIVDPEDWAPVDEAVRHLDVYSWLVLTSRNAVERFFVRVYAAGKDARHLAGLRVAAVGPATAEACVAHGIQPDFVPEEHVAEGVVGGLRARGVGSDTRVLVPRALEARELLPEQLRDLGAIVDVVPVYRNVPGRGDPAVLERLRAGTVDVVTFTSSSTVRNFVRLTQGVDLGRVTVASIGPVTSKTARELGLEVAIEPEDYTIPGLVSAIIAYYREDPRHATGQARTD